MPYVETNDRTRLFYIDGGAGKPVAGVRGMGRVTAG